MYSAILGLCFSDCDCKLVYFLLVDSSFDFSQVQNTAASKIAKKKVDGNASVWIIQKPFFSFLLTKVIQITLSERRNHNSEMHLD